MKITMGIDQSFTSTGVVIMSHEGDTTTVLHYEVIRSNPEDDIYTRCVFIADKIVELAKKHLPDGVLIEGLAFGVGAGDATRNLAGLQFVIITKLKEFINTIQVIAPTSLKKFGTGSGRANKIEMHAALPTNISTTFKDAKILKTKGLYDLVDAYWLACYQTKDKNETS